MTQIDHLGLLPRDATLLYPDRPALLQDDDVISYGELDERAARVAGSLTSRGIVPGDRIALLWENDLHYVESFLGIMRAGGVAVPLNTRQNDDQLLYVLADAAVEGVIAGPTMVERGAELEKAAGSVRFVVTTEELQSGPPRFDVAPYSPDDVCMQPYTSGSTGRPKGVLLTHRGQLWCADIVRKCYLFDETERALLAAPMFHKNAGMTLKSVLISGGACIVLPGFDPAAVIEAIDRYGVTYLSGVPAMYRLLLAERDLLARCDVSSVRFASAGSAPVTVDLLEQFAEVFGAPIAEGYGLTEGGPDVLLGPRWGVNKPGALGLPIPGCEVELRREDGSPVGEVGEVGELWVRNPGVTRGYHNLPEVTNERIRDGWLATRDLMRFDEDGYYYFVGRSDDLINVGGENVYPKEVEQLLLRHPAVRDVAVVGAPHPVRGAVPVAFVVLSGPAAATAEELIRHFHEVGPHYAYPRVVEFVEALPLAGTGKTDRKELEERARSLPVT